MSPVKRFICHFLIVWLALLSGGAHAHVAADAAHALGHVAAQAAQAQAASAQDKDSSGMTRCHDHSEACSLSHCGHGHATGMLPPTPLPLGNLSAAAPLPALQPWASREQPKNIERPKWRFTTPAVVNL